jgi:hypothetical protein
MPERKYKSVNINSSIHKALIKCSKELSKENGFKISLANTINILLYKHFNGTSSYKTPTEIKER